VLKSLFLLYRRLVYEDEKWHGRTKLKKEKLHLLQQIPYDMSQYPQKSREYNRSHRKYMSLLQAREYDFSLFFFTKQYFLVENYFSF
jgi:hypothetical protein